MGPHLEVRLLNGWRKTGCAGGFWVRKVSATCWLASQTTLLVWDRSSFPWEPGSQTKAFASSPYFLWALSPTLSLPLKAPNLCRCGGSGRGAWWGRPQEAHPAQLAARCRGLCAWPICWHWGAPPGSQLPTLPGGPHLALQNPGWVGATARGALPVQRSLQVPAVPGKKKGGSVPRAGRGVALGPGQAGIRRLPSSPRGGNAVESRCCKTQP